MDISIDGWDYVIIALVTVTLLIYIAVVGCANKRWNKQGRFLSTERAGLDGYRREQDQRKLELDTRERELNEREMGLDDDWRDQLNLTAALDRREAEIEARERQLEARKPDTARG